MQALFSYAPMAKRLRACSATQRFLHVAYAHHMIALKDGRIVAPGTPESVMTVDMLATIFGVEAHVRQDPRTGSPMCIAYAASWPCAVKE